MSIDSDRLRSWSGDYFEALRLQPILGRRVERERFQAAFLGAFAATAVLLGMLGVYSVVAFSTAQRTREVGLRMALGAEPQAVVRQLMRSGVVPATSGIIVGLGASYLLSRVLESYLTAIEPTESWVYAGVLIVGVTLVLIASWLPARRASRVDPVSALRHE